MKAIEDLRRELRADLRGVKESVKYCSDACDSVQQISKDIKELRKEIQDLAKANRELRQENDRLSVRVEEMEQYQRANNLEIKGLPLVGDEGDMVLKIAESIGVVMAESDIDICHRVPTARQDEKNVIVRFVQRSKRNAILAAAKKKRLTVESLGFAGARTPIYVNEHLTICNKKLLGAAISLKRQKGWKFVWTAGGRVFARKDEASPALRMANTADLEKIV